MFYPVLRNYETGRITGESEDIAYGEKGLEESFDRLIKRQEQLYRNVSIKWTKEYKDESTVVMKPVYDILKERELHYVDCVIDDTVYPVLDRPGKVSLIKLLKMFPGFYWSCLFDRVYSIRGWNPLTFQYMSIYSPDYQMYKETSTHLYQLDSSYNPLSWKYENYKSEDKIYHMQQYELLQESDNELSIIKLCNVFRDFVWIVAGNDIKGYNETYQQICIIENGMNPAEYGNYMCRIYQLEYGEKELTDGAVLLKKDIFNLVWNETEDLYRCESKCS